MKARCCGGRVLKDGTKIMYLEVPPECDVVIDAEFALSRATHQPIVRYPTPEESAALGEIAMRFVDRAGDYCDEDPAERICDEFYKAMADEVDRQLAARPSSVTTHPTAAAT